MMPYLRVFDHHDDREYVTIIESDNTEPFVLAREARHLEEMLNEPMEDRFTVTVEYGWHQDELLFISKIGE